jgi:type IV secretion system protein VirB11
MTAAAYLDVYLGPFLEQLARPDVTDLYVNRPGEIWIETLQGGLEHHSVPEITEAQLWRLARQIASVTHQGVSREHPLLAARLPDGARVQIVAPPATRDGMAIAIRKHLSTDLSLADYQRAGAFEKTLGTDAADPVEEQLSRLYEAGRWEAFLTAAVRAGKTILVSGGTSTGKTTFLNALLREIDPTERLILIEDTPELVLRHKNAIGLVAIRGGLGEASLSTEDLLIASLRLRPDRIILGELRGAEAFTFLRAVNTGHAGSLTTIHADSPSGAIEQLMLLVLQANAKMQRGDLLPYISRVIDVIVQLERRNGIRRVAQVRWLKRHEQRAGGGEYVL